MGIVNYPSKRAMIQQILETHGYFDWYIAQPDTQNPDSPNPRCILINFAEKKKAELVIPYEWFQRYHRIAKLIALAIQHPSPATFTGPVIVKERSLVGANPTHPHGT
jgi:hypothetical protein